MEPKGGTLVVQNMFVVYAPMGQWGMLRVVHVIPCDIWWVFELAGTFSAQAVLPCRIHVAR